MAKTIRTYVGDGSRVIYPVDFELGYLREEFVFVYSGEDYQTQLDYTWVDSNQIQLVTPVTTGTELRIRRVVPRDELVVSFTNGAVLKDKNLDNSALQPLMILEEIQDGFISFDGTTEIQANTVIKGTLDVEEGLTVVGKTTLSGDLDLLGNALKNVKQGLYPTDGVNLQQLNDALAAIQGAEALLPLIQPRQVGDGVTTTFVTPVSGQAGKSTNGFFVYLDGVYQRPNIDYTVDAGNGNLTFVEASTPTAPNSGVNIDITYFIPKVIDQVVADENSLVIATGTSTARTLGDRFADVITPLDKGAVGDGVADDTSAIVATIQDGRPVDWLNLTYGITGISETVAHNIRWRSNGAVIKNISTTAIGRTIELFIGANTVNISGGLAIDANDKSYIGFRIENTSESKSTLIAEDLTCVNAFRSGTDFVGGSGLNIKGWFERVHLTRPTIKNCHLGAGAGISGIVGISGILVEPKSTTPFQAVEKFYVEDPNIEDVYSDDLLYVIDQDGINFRTASDDPTYDLPWPTDFNVLGGVFKNCWGRSIKCQSENGNVEGTQFIRTTGNEHNGSEIDFQVGAGTVSNIKCIYEAFTPNWVVTLSGARRTGKLVPFGSVSGVKVSVAAGETINAVVNCANREFTRQSWIVRDVNVRGATDYIVRLTGGTNATNILSLSDVTVDTLNEYGVWTGVNSFSNESKCIIKRVFHAGSDVPLMRASAATSPLLSSEDCFGFTEITKVDQEGSGDVGSFLRVDKIAPLDSKESGFLKPFSFLMANNDIVSLPIVGYNSGSNMAILSVSSNKQGKAIITYDTGSATKITSEGTNFETGTTTEPVTGSFRLWVSGGTLQISNRSGTQRMLTGLMIG